MRRRHQKLPSSGDKREALRVKGQFWTPEWVARAMVAYLDTDARQLNIFDPAVGSGAFFLAAKHLARELGKRVRLSGTELDPGILDEARRAGLDRGDLQDVQITDFVFSPPDKSFPGIVANPPYIRHHRLSAEAKAKLIPSTRIATSLSR